MAISVVLAGNLPQGQARLPGQQAGITGDAGGLDFSSLLASLPTPAADAKTVLLQANAPALPGGIAATLEQIRQALPPKTLTLQPQASTPPASKAEELPLVLPEIQDKGQPEQIETTADTSPLAALLAPPTARPVEPPVASHTDDADWLAKISAETALVDEKAMPAATTSAESSADQPLPPAALPSVAQASMPIAATPARIPDASKRPVQLSLTTTDDTPTLPTAVQGTPTTVQTPPDRPAPAPAEMAELATRSTKAVNAQTIPNPAPATGFGETLASRLATDGNGTPAIVAADQSNMPASPANPLAAQTERSVTASNVVREHPASIPAHVNDPRWSQQLGDRVLWMARGEVQSAQINITPAQLGPIQISISLQGDQMTAQFVSAHQEVRQVLEDSLPRLREMLSGAGINLGQANIGAQQQQRDTRPQFAGVVPSAGEDAILPADATWDKQPLQPLSRGRGMVDLFA